MLVAVEDFTIDDVYWGGYEKAVDFGWFCLGHNFDVVATILTMASLSWQKGFDAGLAIADFADRPPWAGPNSVQKYHRYDYANPINTGPIQLSPHPGD